MWHETFPIRAFLQIYLVPNRKFLRCRPKYRSVQENRRRNVEARFVLPSSNSAEHGRNLRRALAIVKGAKVRIAR